MSVRLPPATIPRPGGPAHSPRTEQKREPEKTGTGKAPHPGGGAAAKSTAGGKSGGTQGAQRQEGAESGAQLGAHTGGTENLADTHEAQSPNRFDLLQGEGTNTSRLPPQGQEVPAGPPPSPTAAPELPREQKAEGRENSRSRQEVLSARADLRAVVMERIITGVTDVEGRLSRFLEEPGRLGVVNLNVVLSESSVAYELWQGLGTEPNARVSMALNVGVSSDANDATLMRALMATVHEVFGAFRASPTGRDLLKRYESVLRNYDEVRVLPVIPGHDTGPILAELGRLGIPHELEFSRSLFVHPLLLSVGLKAEEGTEELVMIAGLNVVQLGTLVAQLRRVNPKLTNRQVCLLLLRASTERKKARKSLGQQEMERVLEAAQQLVKLQVFELYFG